MTTSPVIHIADVPFVDHQRGENYAAKFQLISKTVGANKLGYRVTTLPPGKKAWPYHHHHVNEEMFFILEGEGILRYDDKMYPIKKGDFISAVAGDVHTGHQIINNSNRDLIYLCVSTMMEPEICEYPDSKKVMALVGAAPGGDKDLRILSSCWLKSAEVDYWDGEG